jgi:hypothetical protein
MRKVDQADCSNRRGLRNVCEKRLKLIVDSPTNSKDKEREKQKCSGHENSSGAFLKWK